MAAFATQVGTQPTDSKNWRDESERNVVVGCIRR